MADPKDAANAAHLNINIAALQDIALTGVRRATAFLGLGLSALRDGPPKSVRLEGQFIVSWFPDPLPEGMASEIARDFEAWLVGSALKELDQYLSRFLDEAWHLLRLVEFHGQPLPAGFGPDTKFLGETNTAKKLRQIEAAVGAAGIASDFFDGYSFARNALSHNLGFVRPRDTNHDGALRVQWHTPTVVIRDEGVEQIIDQSTGIPNQIYAAGTTLDFRMAQRERVFSVGESISFSRFDLCGICFSYQNAADSIGRGVQEAILKKGIPSAATPAAPNSQLA